MKRILFILLLTLPFVSFGQKELRKEYYNSGEINYEINYTDGLLDGEWKKYYKTGGVSIIGNYKMGKEEGMVKWYNKDGTLSKEYNYKNDKKDGLQKTYIDGVLKEEVMYKNGIDTGIYNRYLYNDKGELYHLKSYKNGSLIYEKCWNNKKEISCE